MIRMRTVGRWLAGPVAGVAVVLVAACGGSDTGSASGPAAGQSTPSGEARVPAALDSELAACLEKNGVTLPTAPADGSRPTGVPPQPGSDGAPPRPDGVSQEAWDKAQKACGDLLVPPSGSAGRPAAGASGST